MLFFSRFKQLRPVKNKISDSELHKVWCTLRLEYFPNRDDLDSYAVYWSSRKQKRVLASCNIRRKKISVAKELRDPIHQKWLLPLLYHEMCHAVIGENVLVSRGKRQWHGREFRELEQRHPKIKDLNNWIKTGGWRYAVRRHRALKNVT